MTRFEGLPERSRVLSALAVAASVLVFTVAAHILMSVLYFVTALFQGQNLGPTVFGGFLAPSYALPVLAFCVGVFAWLWLFAPVSGELHLRGAIVGSLLSVASGTVLAFIVMFGIQMQAWFANANFFSNSLSQATESFARDGGNAFGFTVSSTVQLAVTALPVTVLAVVLTWSWIVRHPAHSANVATQVEV
jgi:hypothetical protein